MSVTMLRALALSALAWESATQAVGGHEPRDRLRMVDRIATGSAGEPVPLAAIEQFPLPDPFPEPGAPEVDGEDFHRLETLVRLPVGAIADAVGAGKIADVESAALLFAVTCEIDHGF